MNIIQQQYNELIVKALSENRSYIKGVYEGHHIFPKEIYRKWKNKEWNRVHLTPEEHNKAHDLLNIIFKEQLEEFYKLNAKRLLKEHQRHERGRQNNIIKKILGKQIHEQNMARHREKIKIREEQLILEQELNRNIAYKSPWGPVKQWEIF